MWGEVGKPKEVKDVRFLKYPCVSYGELPQLQFHYLQDYNTAIGVISVIGARIPRSC